MRKAEDRADILWALLGRGIISSERLATDHNDKPCECSVQPLITKLRGKRDGSGDVICALPCHDCHALKYQILHISALDIISANTCISGLCGPWVRGAGDRSATTIWKPELGGRGRPRTKSYGAPWKNWSFAHSDDKFNSLPLILRLRFDVVSVQLFAGIASNSNDVGSSQQ